jgi:hypothetical protein
MKKNEVPQDPSLLDNFTKEVCYAVDESGQYTTELSRGWEVKTSALGITWQDIEKRIESARQDVLEGKASPVLYFMELRIMDIDIVSAYTGFWKWTIRRHMKPAVFEKLSDKKLQRYASLFEVTIDELKKITVHE